MSGIWKSVLWKNLCAFSRLQETKSKSVQQGHFLAILNIWTTVLPGRQSRCRPCPSAHVQQAQNSECRPVKPPVGTTACTLAMSESAVATCECLRQDALTAYTFKTQYLRPRTNSVNTPVTGFEDKELLISQGPCSMDLDGLLADMLVT
jgi:hypothetical protein